MLDTLTDELHSPCVGICQLDDNIQLCRGCARTGDEIEHWKEMSVEERGEVWDKLVSRRAEKKVGYAMAPLTKRRLGEILLKALDDPATVFMAGTCGALAEFSRSPDESFERFNLKKGFGVETARGAVGFRPFASFKGFRFDKQLTLAVHAKRAALSRNGVIQEIGPDKGVLMSNSQGGHLFDLGLGAFHVDFCIRTNEAALIKTLRKAVGRNIFMEQTGVWEAVKKAQPERVIVTQLARLEVAQPIPEEGEKTPEGPHTHILPELLAKRCTHPPENPLPKTYFPGISLYGTFEDGC